MKDKSNFFKKFVTSIYDLEVFSKYAKEGFFRSIIYALLMTSILGGVKGIFTGYRLNKQITGIENELRSDKHKFYIKNGILNINESPIKFEEANTLIYIDKDVSMDAVDSLKSIAVHQDVSILFLKDGIVINNPIEKYKINYNNIFNGETIENSSIANKANLLRGMTVIVSFIISILITFFNLLINCLIVVAFVSLVTIFMKMVVKYSALYSLTLYAATLPLIIQTILEIINPNVNLDTVFIIGTLIYVILILKYIKSELIEKINKIKSK